MASAGSILFEINSSNYSNPITTIYQPPLGHSGFITTLRLSINLKSIDEANFPYIPDDTSQAVLQEILNQVALDTEYKEVVLFYKKGTGAWIQRAPVRIFNKEPFYDVNLMRFFSDSNTIDVAEDFSLGIQVKPGNILTSLDKISVWGMVVEEKKNNGNEELEARIEALELALSGKLTELSANTLLGRDATTGIVEQIPQDRFAALVNGVVPINKGGTGIGTPHTFRAAASVNQTLVTDVFTKINLGTKVSDSNNQYTPSQSRLTALTNETWRITVYISYSLSSTTRILLSLLKNNSQELGVRILDTVANTGTLGLLLTVPEITLAPGDYLELFTLTTPGSSIVGVSSLVTTFWFGKRIN